MPLFGGCFSRKKKKRRKLNISAPLHLLVKGDVSLQCHAFKSKLFRKKRTCNVCHQPINTHGSSCRVCKYACHKSCEPKAPAHCEDAPGREWPLIGRRSRDVTPERYQGNQAWQIYQAQHKPRPSTALKAALQNEPLAKPRPPPTKPLPQGRLVAGRRCRERPGQLNTAGMELNFVTQRVMALCFPPDVGADTYRENLREVAQMLHGPAKQPAPQQNYMIFNLSEARPELRELQCEVLEYGWPETLAPPLDKLCSICKAIDAWTSAEPSNVAVLHSRAGACDRGGWDRIGVVVSAFIHYSNICRTDQALDRFAMKRFFDDKVRHLDHPSQRRYVNYLAGLLSGLIEINSAPLSLHHLVVVGAPQMRTAGGCRLFVRVYQGLVPVWTSGIYTVADRTKYTVVSPEMPLHLRGDILIKCYHCEPAGSAPPSPASPSTEEGHGREVVFRVQFHTCAVSDCVLSFPRPDLDDACDDMRFPLDGGVELHFSPTSLGPDQEAAPVVVDHAADPAKRCNSLEHFPIGAGDQPDASESLAHTEGPLDGSLYATVVKKTPGGGSSPRTQTHHSHAHSATTSDSHELHTVSMDSGISSSGRERLSGGSSHSPQSGPHSGSSARSAPCDSTPPVAAPETSPRAPPARTAHPVTVDPSVPSVRSVKKQSSVDASQLDELLSGLLENCSNIRDLRPCQTPAPDIDAIQTPTFQSAATRAPSVRARTVSSAGSVPRADADSSGYASARSPSQSQSVAPPVPSHANNMVHYNGYKTSSSFKESFSAKGEGDDIPYHARIDSKPFAYADFGGSTTRRSPSPGSLQRTSPEKSSPETSERRPSQLESPRLVRKLLVGGSSSPAPSKPAQTPPSPVLPRKQFTNGSASTTVKETYTSSTRGRSPSSGIYGRANSFGANDIYSKPYTSNTLKSNATDTIKSVKSNATDTLQSQRSYNTDTMKSYNTDTMRSNTSFNTDTLKSNRSYDWESTIRSTSKTPAAPAAPAPASRAVEPYRRPAASRDVDLLNRNDPNAKTVTTYDQNTNSMTTVSTQSFDVPCSPNPTRRIVETTKRYMVDDDEGRPTGVTKMEETVREFVIEDLPDGPGSAGNITWLQKQQQKLRDRQQARIRSERGPQEARMLQELRQRHGSSGRQEDGYVSDTTLWTDTSREGSPAGQQQLFSQPLHVNTSGARQLGSSAPASPQPPQRAPARERSTSTSRYHTYQSSTQPRPVQRHRSETAYDRARPHVHVARSESTAYERARPHVQTQLRAGQSKVGDQADLTHLINKTQTTTTTHYSSTPVREERNGLLTIANGQSGVRDPPEPRPETPAFPIPPRTPYQNQPLPPKSPTSQRERSPSPVQQVQFETSPSFESSPSAYQGGQHSRRSSLSSDTEVISAHPGFVRDISKWWYKPSISREQAIAMLRDQPAGSFVIRDSNSFPGAFGLALKVETPPTNVAARGAADASSELVRHFLIETTSRGVRLKGCNNEPTFGSLPALVYQHSVTPLALPRTLLLPSAEQTAATSVVDGHQTQAAPPVAGQHAGKHAQLLDTGAACSVLLLYSAEVEALTGPQAVRRATTDLFRQTPAPEPVVVHFKVSSQGITLTDTLRKQFFRRHYNTNLVSHCSMDPEDRRWTLRADDGQPTGSLRIFGVVAKKGPSSGNNQCHLFAEYDADQPASAIVNFITNVMMTSYGARSSLL